MKEKDVQARKSAAVALGEIGDSRAVEPLIKILNDLNSNVRWAAAEALKKIGESAVEPLIESLKDEKIRILAAVALGEIGDFRAVEPLIESLKDDYPKAQWAAAEALQKIGKTAVEPLIESLKDERARIPAVVALGEIGDSRAVEPLTKILQDKNADVRWAAMNALEKISREVR